MMVRFIWCVQGVSSSLLPGDSEGHTDPSHATEEEDVGLTDPSHVTKGEDVGHTDPSHVTKGEDVGHTDLSHVTNVGHTDPSHVTMLDAGVSSSLLRLTLHVLIQTFVG